MSNVRQLFAGDDHGAPPSGGGDGGSEMEERMRRVKDAIVQINATLPHLATSSDLSDSRADIIKWVCGGIFAALAIGITLMIFLFNHTWGLMAALGH